MPRLRRSRLTHLSARGQARMVDVSDKEVTDRTATATAEVRMSREAIAAVRAGRVPKGDVAAVARVAALAAVKRTADLIPLCHPLRVTGAEVDVSVHAPRRLVRVTARVRARDRTGVEMEALCAAAVGALAVYDMCKAIDRGMTVGPVRLVHKAGGRSGTWRRRTVG